MAYFESKLTKGVIPSMFLQKYDIQKDGKPIIQILAVRDMKARDGEETTTKRLKINDGIVENQFVMFTGSKKFVNLNPLCIVQINAYLANVTLNVPREKQILQITDMEVLHTSEECGKVKLGSPVAWRNDGKTTIPKGCKNVGASSAPGKEHTGPRQIPSGGRYVAITTLTPYMNKWTIKGRVTQKGDMRTWNNAKGSGNLFSFTIVDESCDLKCTAFKEDADKFFEQIEKGKVYTISNGSLKNKNPQYNNTQQDYELTLGKLTVIDQVQDDSGMPTQLYDFVTISDMENMSIEGTQKKTVDFVGILQSCDPDCSSITIKSQNREVSKREIVLIDDTQKSIKCTLWGDVATNFDTNNINSLMIIKAASLGTFNGRSLSIGVQSDVQWNLKENERASQLMDWWTSKGSSVSFSTVSSGGTKSNEWMCLNQINTHSVGATEAGRLFFTTKATITFIGKENPAYKACRGKDGNKCNKKLIDEGNGNYRCERCDISTVDFDYRIILKSMIADDTAAVYTTFFGEQGEHVLEMSSNDFGKLLENKDGLGEMDYEKAINRPVFKEYLLDNRATNEVYQDENRLRVATSRIAEIDYPKYTEKLLAEISVY